MIGDIMGISRLRMAIDGMGVSTLVAFYDCLLHCKYCTNNFCHDSEQSLYGTPRVAYRPEELVEVLRKDEIYYLMTGGGIVFGGGEPLLQSVFIHEVCRLLDSVYPIRIETSLNVHWRYIEPLLKDIDEWIVDIKDMNRFIYQKYTGTDNDKVVDNLYRMKEIIEPDKWHIRVPIIDEYNDSKSIEESVEKIRDILHVEPEVFRYIVLPHGDN